VWALPALPGARDEAGAAAEHCIGTVRRGRCTAFADSVYHGTGPLLVEVIQAMVVSG
jgi:hypothetical protein